MSDDKAKKASEMKPIEIVNEQLDTLRTRQRTEMTAGLSHEILLLVQLRERLSGQA